MASNDKQKVIKFYNDDIQRWNLCLVWKKPNCNV